MLNEALLTLKNFLVENNAYEQFVNARDPEWYSSNREFTGIIDNCICYSDFDDVEFSTLDDQFRELVRNKPISYVWATYGTHAEFMEALKAIGLSKSAMLLRKLNK